MMRRFRNSLVAACLVGIVFGIVGTSMNWSHAVALVVLSVAGTITTALTLHTSLFDELRPPRQGATRTRARG